MNKEEIISDLRSKLGVLRAKSHTDIEFIIDDEQSFLDRGSIENQSLVYFVVRFEDTSINYGASVLPISLIVFGLPNEIKNVQSFLDDFVSTYHLKDGYFWNSPRVMGNFNEMGDSFKSLFSIQGFYIYAENAIDGDLYFTDSDGTILKLDLLSFQDDSTNSVEPQVYSGGNNRTKSYVASQTYCFSIGVYATKNAFTTRLVNHKYSSSDLTNETFKFSLKLNGYDLTGDGYVFKDWEFKCKSVQFVKQIGQLNRYSVAFTL